MVLESSVGGLRGLVNNFAALSVEFPEAKFQSFIQSWIGLAQHFPPVALAGVVPDPVRVRNAGSQQQFALAAPAPAVAQTEVPSGMQLG